MRPNGLPDDPSPKPPGATNHSVWLGPLPSLPKASTSVSRLQPSAVPSISTRMRVVVTAGKVIARFTSVLPRMTPPGTVCHPELVQAWTVKSETP